MIAFTRFDIAVLLVLLPLLALTGRGGEDRAPPASDDVALTGLVAPQPCHALESPRVLRP